LLILRHFVGHKVLSWHKKVFLIDRESNQPNTLGYFWLQVPRGLWWFYIWVWPRRWGGNHT